MNATVEDLRSTIVPRSDQLNTDQLLAGPMIITITDVKTSTAADQPVQINYRNDNGRPYRPCLTMRKVLILAWGHDGRQWVGKSLELYADPSVKFGGDQVGGIRIARMSDIPKDIRVSLTATKGKKAMHEIKVLKVERPERTPRHDQLVAGMETVAREQGLAAFQEVWKNTPKEDRAAIGIAERDRIAAIGTERDNSTPTTTETPTT